LTAAFAPLSVALSMKLAPIVNEREAFFRSQMTNVAERGSKVAQIRVEMHDMIERRKKLEIGENSLARMFDVLVKFRSSLGMEEEEEEDFDPGLLEI
jgi:hypothetical protein